MNKLQKRLLIGAFILGNISFILAGIANAWGTKEWLITMSYHTGVLGGIDLLCFGAYSLWRMEFIGLSTFNEYEQIKSLIDEAVKAERENIYDYVKAKHNEMNHYNGEDTEYDDGYKDGYQKSCIDIYRKFIDNQLAEQD